MEKLLLAEITPQTRLTVAEAATAYNLPKWKLWRAIRAGLLRSERLLNGRLYLRPTDIETALSSSSTEVRHG